MQKGKYWAGKLSEAVEKLEHPEHADEEGHTTGWLDQLKEEMEERRLAETEAQFRRDELMAMLLTQMNKVHSVELLEEMNRVLLDNQGRVEPIFTIRHELCLSWPVEGGRNKIAVGADYDDATDGYYLLVTGKDQQRIPTNEEDLKKALVKAFREPRFDDGSW